MSVADMLTKVTLQGFDELIRQEQQSWRNEQNPATASRSLKYIVTEWLHTTQS